ncbi:MAG: hypothetical protein HW391_909 [Chloroflexi bacterium]|nr:hypothetical protein [Chloroflexota bacterium]
MPSQPMNEQGTATPTTIAGRAALSGMRPHVKRALARTIVAIETEAAAPYVEALREAAAVLAAIAELDETGSGNRSLSLDVAMRALQVHDRASELLAGANEAGGTSSSRGS